MIITQTVLDSVMRKNGRAQRRMARRLARKASVRRRQEFGIRAGSVRFTDLEMNLNQLTRPNYYKKAHARMHYLVDRDVARQAKFGVGVFSGRSLGSSALKSDPLPTRVN